MGKECKFTNDGTCLVQLAQKYLFEIDRSFLLKRNLKQSGIDPKVLLLLKPVLQQTHIDTKESDGSQLPTTCRGCEYYNRKVFKPSIPHNIDQEA